jgi:transcriptional regulator with XRE-family HTH domain
MTGKKKQLTPREVFGKNIKRARLLRDLSQEAVALEAGMTGNYIGDVERGARNIAIDNMARLAAALKVPLHELLDPGRFHDPIDETP